MSKDGLTLLEILIATLLFALVVTGLAHIFLAGKRHIRHGRSRITASEFNKYVLDVLPMQVRQDEWATNCLGQGINCATTVDQTWTNEADNIIYSTTTISSAVSGTELRKVVTRVNWSEPTP